MLDVTVHAVAVGHPPVQIGGHGHIAGAAGEVAAVVDDAVLRSRVTGEKHDFRSVADTRQLLAGRTGRRAAVVDLLRPHRPLFVAPAVDPVGTRRGARIEVVRVERAAEHLIVRAFPLMAQIARQHHIPDHIPGLLRRVDFFPVDVARNHAVILIVHRVEPVGHAELLLVAEAACGLGPLPRLVQRRQQHRRENGDDGDNDQELNQCEVSFHHNSPSGWYSSSRIT